MRQSTRFLVVLAGMFIWSTSLVYADNASLSCTPGSVSFTKPVNSTSTKEIAINLSGLPLLTAVTSFTVDIQGADAGQFIVENPTANLIDLLKELLGGGHKLKVTYKSTTPGNHSAQLVISASLLGLGSSITSAQTTVSLSGTAVGAPQAISTTPLNGATEVSVSTPVSITYGEAISVLNAGLIKINDVPVQNVTVNGSILELTPATPLTEFVNYKVTVGAGAIQGANSNPSTADFSFSFTTVAEGTVVNPPQVVSTNPLNGAAQMPVNATISITYNEAVSVVDKSLITLNGQVVQDATTSGMVLTLVPSASLENSTSYIVVVGAGAVQGGKGNLTTGDLQFSFETQQSPTTGNEDLSTGKIIKAEEVYTTSGVRVNATLLHPGTLYIKRVWYEDGSVETIKVVEPLM